MTAIASEPKTRSDRLLRLALRIDATCSGVSGVLLAATAGWLSGRSGLPLAVEYGLAAVLVAYAVAVFGVSRLASVRRPGIVVVAANLIFTVAAVLVIVDDVWPLTTLGVTLMIVSAVYTLAMAELQYAGVRRA